MEVKQDVEFEYRHQDSRSKVGAEVVVEEVECGWLKLESGHQDR